MTEQEERKWRRLCDQAMSENDPGKLLDIFLELNRTMEREQRVAASVVPVGKRRPPAVQS
jgi:hypothetical protein